MKKILAMGLVSCLIIGLLGCTLMPAKTRKAGPSSILEPQGVLKFTDVPVPAKFKLLPKDSYSFESSGMRVGLLKYQGKANVEQVVNFYKEQMAMYNWRLLNIIEYGERLLNFDRDQETCIISLLVKGNDIIITISLGPKSQYPKRSERPMK